VGPSIDYVLIKTVNPYLGNGIHVVLAKQLLSRYFELDTLSSDTLKPGDGSHLFSQVSERNIPLTQKERFIHGHFSPSSRENSLRESDISNYLHTRQILPKNREVIHLGGSR
jgi:hypothetical protein